MKKLRPQENNLKLKQKTQGFGKIKNAVCQKKAAVGRQALGTVLALAETFTQALGLLKSKMTFHDGLKGVHSTYSIPIRLLPTQALYLRPWKPPRADSC